MNPRLASAPAVPRLSIARTVTVCAPAARPGNAFGLVHAANAPLSSLHSYRSMSVSAPENRTLAAVPATSTPSIVGALGAGSSYAMSTLSSVGVTSGAAVVSVARYCM